MRVAVMGAVALSLGSLPSPASVFGAGAAEPSYDPTAAHWLMRDRLSGNWGGIRDRLEAAGIKLRAHHTSESAYNPTGGLSHAARYTQQIDFGADLDLDRLAGIRDGEVLITFTHRAGRSLSADALGHNVFAVQEVFGGGRTLRLVELHYQHKLLGRRLLLDIGWAPVGSYFASSPPVYCSYFQTLGACGTLFFNGSWSNYPIGQWGARIRFEPRPAFSISTGVYQVDPRHVRADAGLDLGFGGTGVLVPVELGWRTGRERGLPGEYKLGGYFDSSRAPDVLDDVNGQSAGLTGAPFARHNGRWGVYALATQMVHREKASAKRGLSLFGMIATADRETATFSWYFVAGAIYQGTFRGRDDDYVAIAFAQQRFNHRRVRFQRDRAGIAPGMVGIQTRESVIEVNYRAAVTPWLQLRPSLQYVIRPGGTGTIPNPLVLGLFTRITF